MLVASHLFEPLAQALSAMGASLTGGLLLGTMLLISGNLLKYQILAAPSGAIYQEIQQNELLLS